MQTVSAERIIPHLERRDSWQQLSHIDNDVVKADVPVHRPTVAVNLHSPGRLTVCPCPVFCPVVGRIRLGNRLDVLGLSYAG